MRVQNLSKVIAASELKGKHVLTKEEEAVHIAPTSARGHGTNGTV